MSARGPWSVKGIDSKAREAALQAARNEGITLGDYLNRLLLESDQNAAEAEARRQQAAPHTAHNDVPDMERPAPRATSTSTAALDELTRRVEAAEARSRLAITDIDKSVVGLLNRLDDTEKSQQAIEGRIDVAAEELQQAQALLKRRIDQIEADDASHQSLRAMRSLEKALENLSERIEQTRSETEAKHASAENQLKSLDERLGEMDQSVTQKVTGLQNSVTSQIENASAKVDRALSETVARTEGANKHLTDRMTQVERDVTEINHNVSGTLTKVSESVERFGRNIAETENRSVQAFDLVSRLEEQAKAQRDDVEGQLEDIAERLSRAEMTTDAALSGLESSFSQLDERLGQFEGEGLVGLRAEFEERIEAIKSELAQTISETRAELTGQIETAASQSTEVFSEMNSAVNEIAKRMRRTEQRQTQAVEAIGEEVTGIAEKLDKRVATVEQRNDSEIGSALRDQLNDFASAFQKRLSEIETRETGEPLESVTAKMDELASALNSRVEASEERSASAIRDFTDHVTTLTKNLQARQDESVNRLSSEIQASEQRQSEKVETALGKVTDRIAQVEQATSSSISPIQKAMASLAERLSAVEDFSNPDGVSRPAPPPMSFDSFEARLDAADAKQKSAAAPEIPEELDTDFEIPEPPAPKAETAKPAPVEDDPWADFGDDEFEAPSPKASFDDDLDEPDDGFAADVPGSGFDLDAAEFDENTSFENDSFDDDAPMSVPDAGSASDYLSRARAAANAAQESGRGRKAPKVLAAKGGKKGGGSSKLPLIAAASVIAIAAAGAAGFMLMRGKQDSSLDYLDGPSARGQVDGRTPLVPSAGADELSALENGADAGIGLEIVGPEVIESEAAVSDTVEETTPRREERLIESEPAPAPAPRSAETAEAPAPAPVETARNNGPTTSDLNRSQLTGQPISIQNAVPIAPSEMASAQPAVAEPAAPLPPVVTPVTQYQDGMRLLEEGNIREAVTLIQNSADDGLAMAQYRMSKLYERGQGVPRDLTQSRQWTELAAENGNVKAMHDLAVFFAEGEGGPQSYAGAAQWFRSAAEYGLVDSQYNLGVLYEQGLGVTADPAEALYWYAVAEQMGDSGAGSKVSELAAQIDPTAAQSALRRAAAYTPTQSDPAANGIFPQQPRAAASTPAATSAPTELALNGQVRQAQELLNELGYNAGFPDGRFGNQTRNAILAFQGANGYPQSGQVTPTLLRQMRAAADTGL